jgi:uncharacterized protein
MAEILCWATIFALFALSFIALRYPFLPGFIMILGAFFAYGFCFTFEQFGFFFWTIQLFFMLSTFAADYFSNLYAVRMHGGSNVAVYGSLAGLIAGPVIIPFAGLVAGPFLGAVLAEWIINKKRLKIAVRSGLGALIGLAGSTLIKAFIQFSMILTFTIWVLWNA